MIAQVDGIEMRHLGRIERGEDNPSLAFLVKLATTLGTAPNYLLG